jgi:hypothetical protein
MCDHVKFPDGSFAWICGVRRTKQFCACGRAGELLCDWKVKGKKSGTCDAPICRRCAHQVGPDKHLCREHTRAWADWKQRNKGAILPPDYQQLSLL